MHDVEQLEPTVQRTSITGHSLFILKEDGKADWDTAVSIQMPTEIAEWLERLIKKDRENG